MNLDTLKNTFQGRLLTDAIDTAPFLSDWRKRWRGKALGVAQPDSAADVAAVVRWCVQNQVKMVPQGGNTGLVGGSVPDDSGDSLVISLTRMNRVRAIDPINNTMTLEAGCILANAQQAARDARRLFPLSLAAQGSCTIGGNLSTNAGGVQVLRYGNSRELCLGLEVITADGELWDGLRGLRKDNTGYDLKDLYVGAEGTLGIITAATMKLFPLPAAQMTALAGLSDPQAALRLLELAQQQLGPALTAFELMSDFCIALVERHFPSCKSPLAQRHPYYVLLESSDAESEQHATERFNHLMELALEQSLIDDAVIATSMAQSQALWALRENVSEAQSQQGKNIKHDISVPISSIGDFIVQTNRKVERAFPGIQMVVFGHLGDGNLHYNVSPADGVDEQAFMALEPGVNHVVYEAVMSMNGSISAEHGLGQLKIEENRRYKSAVELALMSRIKQALDPRGLMNPGRVL
jgi:FAD/FMN-containing dehydrogenase